MSEEPQQAPQEQPNNVAEDDYFGREPTDAALRYFGVLDNYGQSAQPGPSGAIMANSLPPDEEVLALAAELRMEDIFDELPELDPDDVGLDLAFEPVVTLHPSPPQHSMDEEVNDPKENEDSSSSDGIQFLWENNRYSTSMVDDDYDPEITFEKITRTDDIDDDFEPEVTFARVTRSSDIDDDYEPEYLGERVIENRDTDDEDDYGRNLPFGPQWPRY